MNTINYDLKINAGSTYSLAMTYKEDATSNAIDLTGFTAKAHFRRYLSSDEIEFELSTTNNRIIINGLQGQITISISATDTTLLSGNYVYDLELISPSGQITRLLQGKVIISSEVTRG